MINERELAQRFVAMNGQKERGLRSYKPTGATDPAVVCQPRQRIEEDSDAFRVLRAYVRAGLRQVASIRDGHEPKPGKHPEHGKRWRVNLVPAVAYVRELGKIDCTLADVEAALPAVIRSLVAKGAPKLVTAADGVVSDRTMQSTGSDGTAYERQAWVALDEWARARASMPKQSNGRKPATSASFAEDDPFLAGLDDELEPEQGEQAELEQ